MKILFHTHLDSYTVIATKFCTWHDSCAVVACAKICCDLMASNGVMARWSFHRIWIAGQKHVSETGPWADSRFLASQWQTSLESNTVPHWLGPNLESALHKLFNEDWILKIKFHDFTLLWVTTAVMSMKMRKINNTLKYVWGLSVPSKSILYQNKFI